MVSPLHNESKMFNNSKKFKEMELLDEEIQQGEVQQFDDFGDVNAYDPRPSITSGALSSENKPLI